MPQVVNNQWRFNARLNELQRLAKAGQIKSRSEHWAAVDDPLDGLTQGPLVQRALQVKAEDVVIDCRFGAVLAVIEHARLQHGERVSVVQTFG